MEAFTYENIYYDDCSIRHSFHLLKPGSKRMKTPDNAFHFISAVGLIACLFYIFFMKDIFPLQKAITDEKKGLYTSCIRMIDTPKCGLQPSRENVFLRSSAVINMKDWTFKTKIACPIFSTLTLPHTRKKLIIECKDSKGTIRYDTTGNTSDVFTIPFKSISTTNCLVDVIEHCCIKIGAVVPNVVHYGWYSYKELGFFSFLSFMSVLRFIQPCLILIHGSYVPFGKYWDYFISIAPNVIHVRREHSTKVFGPKLTFDEHSSDAMRTEALTAYGGIYLDSDGIILKPLTPLMRYDYTQVHELFMPYKNAEFLRLWYKRYKGDYMEDWKFNAQNFRADLARKKPHLIHIEGYNVTQPSWKEVDLIFNKNYDWSVDYILHLLIRRYQNETTVENIRQLNTTIGSVSRYVLLGNKELCQN